MKAFFDAVRPAFRRGKLSEAQVAGLTAIVSYGRENGYQRSHLAYVLATAFHETGEKMQPVREGFASTDAGARRAVKGLFDKGIIRRNYALPDKAGNSFYGRGLVQITHKANYAKWNMQNDPDLALGMDMALAILFTGMDQGMFRKGKSLAMISAVPTPQEFRSARGMINGDVRKNGTMIADYAIVFYNALLPLYAVEIADPETPEEEHSLWCRLLDLIGLGDH